MPPNKKSLKSAIKSNGKGKGKQGQQSPKTKLTKAVQVALPREESPDQQDLAPTEEEEEEEQDLLEFDEEMQQLPMSGEEDSDEGSGSEDESDDVTPEAMERMMKLLGEVDAAELGLVMDGDEDEEEEGSDDEEEEGSDDDAEELYEELEEDDTDIVPVEKNTTNDKVSPPSNTSLLVLPCRYETDSERGVQIARLLSNEYSLQSK